MLAPRDRLRSRFIRFVRSSVQRLTAAGESELAVGTLQRAVELEPFAEALHRELIAAFAASRREAEAIVAYRRCERLLGKVLGVTPSPQTRAACPREAG
jgi:DNA-binding SARP family transcriptional activator